MTIALLVTGGCSESTAPDITTTTTTSSATTTVLVPPGLETFEIRQVTLVFDDGGRELLVAVADEAPERSQGLMRVTELAGLDGMLFEFDRLTEGGFWMKDTVLPLTLIHFDETGSFVSSVDMEPCTTADCPSYYPAGPYRFALEVVQGTLERLPVRLVLP
ncbi:MAG: DUF192 domain-containing protein [Acidimicrobiia bacterium]|nr:DUF192 domain-containing protein [Acidimicrobiia bacterium]